MRNILFLISIFSFISVNLFSQGELKQGNPFITNYYSKDYKGHAQNWAITQDSRGVMYFGNGDKGVMEFDGENFGFIPVANNSTVLSLDIDKNDKIYVGAVGEFGYIEADSIGQLVYKSYLDKINPADKNFTDVWATLCTTEGVYFFTKNVIFFINDNKVKTWYPKTSSFFLAYLVKSRLYVLETGYGLLALNNYDELELIPGGDRFKNERIYSIQQYDSEKLLIVTRNQGLVLYDSINGYSGFPTEADNFLKSNLLYSCKILPDNKIVLGTLLGGVAIINKDGKLIQILDKNTGLIDDIIYCTFFDKESNLWLGLSNGISKVEINHPITSFNELNGLKGSVIDIYRYSEILYAATFTGTYYLDKNQFIQISGLADQSWKLAEFTPEVNGKSMLLVGTYSGIYEIKNNKSQLIKKLPNCQNIIISKKHKNRIYTVTGTHLAILEYKNDVWENIGIIPGLDTYMKSIVENPDGSLWICTDIDGIYHLTFENPDKALNTKIIKYGLENGISKLNNLRIFEYKNKLLFDTGDSLYIFNSGENNFTLDTSFNKYLPDNINAFYLFSESNNNLWISDHLNNPQQVGYIKNINDNPNWYDTPFKRLPEMYIYSIFHDENNVTWIGGSELIYRYDPDKDNLEYDSQYNTLIRKVTINQDSIIFSGTQHYDKTTKSYKQSGIPEIEFKNNTILFYFSAVEYSDKKNHKFQHYLVGYDKKWSSFSDISFKEYTNLPKGNYTFRVKAINTYGCESTEAFYQFVILTPWYSSILAYVIYVILFIVLFILTVKLNIKRLKAHNKHLEKLVKERTSEITQQKEEISTQAENLLKANEELEKLSIAVSKTDNAIVIMDAKGNFEWVNDGFTRLYNLTFDEFITKRGKNILDCSSNPNIKEELHKCIYEKETISYEFFYLTESNKKVWTQTTITPILDDKNEVIRLIAIDSDITDVKLAENEILQKNEEILAQKDELEKHRFHLEKLVKERTTDLEKAKEKAEESDRLKSSFLANMSHEIRTPMNAIVGFTNLLNDPEISPAQREELSKLVIHNSDTLLRLIDDIIDIAKLESGQLVIEKQNFDLNNLLVKKFKIFNENNQLINKGHLALKFNNKTNNEQFIIYSDPLRIQQILSNLINNALKYTDQGFVEFGYKPEVHHKKPVITFYVKDTGIGLSGEQQKIIFSRFTKVEDNKKKLYRGAGLGLAISKNIVELLGGNIWVESETGKGSVFYFTIPYENIIEGEMPVKAKPNQQADNNWPGKTILIAEDEESNYLYFKMLISKTKANILHAKNGNEAIKICQEKTVDLVLMDIKMPEMDGLEATKKIKKDKNNIPIIALTAFAMENDEKMSLDAGCDAYISKPINESKLLMLLNKFLS